MTRDAPSWVYWIDVIWAVLMMKLLNNSTMMLTVTLVHPVVLVSIGYGVRYGLALASVAAAGLLLDSGSELMRSFHEGWAQAPSGVDGACAGAGRSAHFTAHEHVAASSGTDRRFRGAAGSPAGPPADLRRAGGALAREHRRRRRRLILPARIGTPAMLATRRRRCLPGAQRSAHARRSLAGEVARCPGQLCRATLVGRQAQGPPAGGRNSSRPNCGTASPRCRRSSMCAACMSCR